MTGDELRIKGIIRGCEITRRNLGPLAGTGQLMKDVLWLAGEVRRLQTQLAECVASARQMSATINRMDNEDMCELRSAVVDAAKAWYESMPYVESEDDRLIAAIEALKAAEKETGDE